MRTRRFSLISLAFAVGCMLTSADARPLRDGRSLDRILPEIRQQHPGTLFDADGPFTGPDGREHYRLKWMTPEGRVMWFDADTQTGRVSNIEGRRRDDYYDRRGDDRRDDTMRDDDRIRDDNQRDERKRERRRDRFGGGDPFGGDPFGGGIGGGGGDRGNGGRDRGSHGGNHHGHER